MGCAGPTKLVHGGSTSHLAGSAANISVPNTSGQTDRFVRFTNLCMNRVSTINPAYGTGKSITV